MGLGSFENVWFHSSSCSAAAHHLTCLHSTSSPLSAGQPWSVRAEAGVARRDRGRRLFCTKTTLPGPLALPPFDFGSPSAPLSFEYQIHNPFSEESKGESGAGGPRKSRGLSRRVLPLGVAQRVPGAAPGVLPP